MISRVLIALAAAAFASYGQSAPEPVILEIQALLGAGRPDAARVKTDAALKRFPKDGGLYNLSGILYAQSGSLPDARKAFERAVALAPRLEGAYLNLARACDEAGDSARALETFEKLLAFAPSRTEARWRAAELHVEAGHAQQASRHFALLSGEERGADRGKALEAAILEAKGDLPGARKLFESMALRDLQNPAPLLALARIAHRQGDREGALGYLGRARDVEPGNAYIHFFFGIVCVEMDLPVEAKKWLEKAVELDPAQPNYQYALGAVLLQGSGTEAAIRHFQEYRRLRPGDARGRFALGTALFQAARLEEARAEFLAALADSATAAGANFFLGRIAKSMGEPDQAREYFEEAARRAPGQADLQAELGWSLLRDGKIGPARAAIERALAIDPNNRVANQQLLALYQRQKDPRATAQRERVTELERRRDEALPLLMRTLELRPPGGPK